MTEGLVKERQIIGTIIIAIFCLVFAVHEKLSYVDWHLG